MEFATTASDDENYEPCGPSIPGLKLLFSFTWNSRGAPSSRMVLPLPPSRDTGRDALIAKRTAELYQLAVRALPLQVAQSLLERDVVAQGGQSPVKQGLLAPLGQAFGQAGGAAWRYRR